MLEGEKELYEKTFNTWFGEVLSNTNEERFAEDNAGSTNADRQSVFEEFMADSHDARRLINDEQLVRFAIEVIITPFP